MNQRRVTVIDLNSAAGTLVNGEKVSTQALRRGDLLQVGDTVLRLGSDDETSTLPRQTQKPPSKPAKRPVVAHLSELVGETLGHFKIGSILGKGQTGYVFRAADQKVARKVALKVLRREISKDEDEIRRFIRAMKTMMPLRHPNLVSVYGAGKTAGYCWIAMELVEGESLTQVLERIGVAGMLDWRHAHAAAVHIARALEYAHEKQVLHRNIMPQNVVIQASDNTAKLGDLMLAKALDGKLSDKITKPGELIGDVHYMSPERTRHGMELDGRADIYSLGAMVYALLTGRPPFVGTTLVETLKKIHSADPVPPRQFQMSIPAQFEGVVLRMLAKRPAERYSSARSLLVELERVGKYHRVTI